MTTYYDLLSDWEHDQIRDIYGGEPYDTDSVLFRPCPLFYVDIVKGRKIGAIDLMDYASRHGDIIGLKIAHNLGALNLSDAMRYSARAGSVKMCRKIRSWALDDCDFIGDISTLMHGAARGGSANMTELFRLAKMWGVEDYDEMLSGAARRGSRELCLLARRHGADNMCVMLYHGARGGHREICELAREWNATSYHFEYMLRGAARYGSRELCELAREWGANDFDLMLCSAAKHGHLEICELAYEWGARDFDGMFRNAMQNRHHKLCELARAWETRDFNDLYMVREVT